MIYPTLSRPHVPRQPHFTAQKGHYPIEMPVMISLNGVDFKASQFVTFRYYDLSRVLVAAVRPSGGPPSGGTLVNVSGTFFLDYGGGVQGPRCRFGSVVVPATLLSFTQAQCISPPQPLGDAQRVPVSISLNGYTDERGLAGGQLRFRYRVAHTLSALHPLGGPARGLSVVTVSGTGFVDMSGVRTANCSADDHARRTDRASYGPYERTEDYVLCKMYEDALGYGPHLMLGRNVPNDADPGLACLFGEPAFAVPASITSDSQIVCPTPPITELQGLRTPGVWCATGHPHCTDPAYAEHGILAVPVRVTLNGNHSDTYGFLPWFIMPKGMPRAFHASPWGGPADGGTNVTIVGEALLDLGMPLCRFGHIDVPALAGGVDAHSSELTPLVTQKLVYNERSLQEIGRQAGRLISCTAPPGHEFGGRSVNLHISLDGENFVSVAGGFSYIEHIEVNSLFPRGGPLAGGYSVTVNGAQFPKLGGGFGKLGLLCEFGGQSVPASVAGMGQLVCTAPPAEVAGAVLVRITLNGDLGDALAVSGNRTFNYYDAQMVRVTAVEPGVGDRLGDTRVTVRGNGFAIYGTPKCRFGDHEPVDVASFTFREPNANETNMTNVTQSNEDTVDGFICHTPAHELPDGRDTDDILVEVSLTGYPGQYSTNSGTAFQYQTVCYGRDTFAYYDTYPGAALRFMDYLIRLHPDLRKYDLDGNRTMDLTEYRAMRDIHDATPDAELQQALETYAQDTCFDPGTPGKTMAVTHDAMGVPIDIQDQSGGLLWYSGATVYSTEEGPG